MTDEEVEAIIMETDKALLERLEEIQARARENVRPPVPVRSSVREEERVRVVYREPRQASKRTSVIADTLPYILTREIASLIISVAGAIFAIKRLRR